MNPARLDMATDWRRFWWAGPPLMIALVLFLVLRVTDSGASPVAKLDDAVSQQFPAGPATVVDVTNFSGDIKVQSGAAGRVVVSVKRHGGGANADEAFDQLAGVQLRMGQEGDAIKVTTWYEGTPMAGTGAEVTISAPPRTQLLLQAQQGSVTLAGMLGDVRAESSGGDISVRLPAGASFALNGGGNLKSEFRLSADADTGQYLANTAEAGASVQRLMLTAVNGAVVLRRQ